MPEEEGPPPSDAGAAEEEDTKAEGREGRDRRPRRSSSRERKDRGRRRKSRERSRGRDRRERDKDKDRRRGSRSRERKSSRTDRSSSRERRRERSKERRRERSRSKQRRARSRSRDKDDYGGYQPRPPRLMTSREATSAPSPSPAAAASVPPAPVIGPHGLPVMPAALRPQDPMVQQLLQQQQMQSQQMLLQQQLFSATTTNTAKAQKEARAARRVYVGNLQPLMVTEEQLKAIFNSALMAAFPGSAVPGMEPVIGITRQAEGRYAFLEFRTPEMATAALQLNAQVTLHGKPISVQRPQDYVDPTKQAQAAQMAQMLMAGLQPGAAAGVGVPGVPLGLPLPGPLPQ